MDLTKDKVEAAIDRFVELEEKLEGFDRAHQYFVRSSRKGRKGGPFSTKPIAALALDINKPQQLNGGFKDARCAASLLHNAGFIIVDESDNPHSLNSIDAPHLIKTREWAKLCELNYFKNLPKNTQRWGLTEQRNG